MSTFDISKYQGVVSVATFQAARARGYERVILKLGGGDDGRYEDSCYRANLANARTAGLIVEGYWFNGTTDVTGDAQFAASLAGLGMRIWWDAENEGSMPHWTPAQVNLAGRTVQATNPCGAYMSSSVTFEDDWSSCTWMPLWVANYDADTAPSVGYWTRAVLWQNTSKGSIPGIPGYVDLDVDLISPTDTASSGTITEVGPLMALSDAEQAELLNNTRVLLGYIEKGGASVDSAKPGRDFDPLSIMGRLNTIEEALFVGGTSMKDGGKSVSQTLADERADTKAIKAKLGA